MVTDQEDSIKMITINDASTLFMVIFMIVIGIIINLERIGFITGMEKRVLSLVEAQLLSIESFLFNRAKPF